MVDDVFELSFGEDGCRLCPRECKALRAQGERGICGATDVMRIARADLHMWEEPCLSGERGSGTIFFSGCNLRCIFCQNYEIKDGLSGWEVSPKQLAEEMLRLQNEKRAHNINLVTGAMFVPGIAQALELARREGLTIPVVYNSSAYEKIEALRALEGLVDVYLPDFKYWDNALSERLSAAADYRRVASAAIDEMLRQTGTPVFDEAEMLIRGTMVRHLVLPGHCRDSEKVLYHLFSRYGASVLYSVMSQYTPMQSLSEILKEKAPKLGRPLMNREYKQVLAETEEWMDRFEVPSAQVFVQMEKPVSESFVPKWGK